MKLFTPVLLFFFSSFFLEYTLLSPKENDKTPYSKPNREAVWVDSVLTSMTLDQKVGQLFMIATYSNRTEQHYATIEEFIKKYHVGGLIFFQGNVRSQANLTNRYQKLAKTPLLIGIDGEWGLGMRLEDAPSYPKQITLGALENQALIEEMGRQVGNQCKRLGVHINFAPVADVNTNPDNPVINYRSFGESPKKVALYAASYAKGLRKAGVIACAKHFPGHGDTDVDSHYNLPIINHSRDRLENQELLPFRVLISDSIGAVMTGHLFVPALDNRTGRAATVSDKIVTNLLRNTLKFEGLAVTDAMNMRGITRLYGNGEAELEAFKAGNDLLLQPAHLPAAFEKIMEAIQAGELTISRLDASVKRILLAKYRAGLSTWKPVELDTILDEINTKESEKLLEQIYAEAVTVVRVENGLLPFIQLDTLEIGLVAVNSSNDFPLYKEISKYGSVYNYELPFKPGSRQDWKHIVEQAETIDVMVVGVHDMNSLASRNFGVSASTLEMIEELNKKTKVIVVAFGNPYGLQLYNAIPNVLCAYEDHPGSYKAVAKILFGAQSSRGKLPVTINSMAKEGAGFISANTGRLIEAAPETVGVNSRVLNEIDRVVAQGIENNAFPGCQVLVARRGKVVYHKAFGTLRYGTAEKVTTETIYDLASLTKVTATLQAVMLLNERGLLDLNRRASYYVKELRGTDKENLVIADILLHQAGLRSFEAYWTRTKTGSVFEGKYYSFQPKDGFLSVSEDLFVTSSIKDSVLQWIIASPFTSRKDREGEFRYLYSDLGLILTQRVVEVVSGQSLDEFLEQNLYEPLGMNSTGFNPLTRFPKDQIAPTEYDQIYRKSQIWGTVHDPNAALLGGVAGHAGLFSNAWDLAKLLQMNLQHGVYGGRRYLFPETLEHFAKNYTNKSHRGIGWNKPKDGADLSSVASTASLSTYGHTGFTGTVAWVDPERDLIFIMLANRVYPNASNNTLNKLETRKKIHEIINRSIDEFQ